MPQPVPFAVTKSLHPFYRDALTRSFTFESLGNVPEELARWVVDARTLDLALLHHHLANIGSIGLGEANDRALTLMFELIVSTNSVLQRNNPGNIALPAAEVARLKAMMNEVLTLQPNLANLVNVALLLFRLNEIDELMGFITANATFLATSPVMRNLLGVISTMEGEHAQAVHLLAPLSAPEVALQYPFADLCHMSSSYALGQWPQAPVRFDSVKARHTRVDGAAAGLPTLQMLQAVKHRDRPILMVACNDAYFFQHALTLAYSLAATNADTLSLHIHLYAPGLSLRAEIETLRDTVPMLDLGVSFEEIPASFDGLEAVYFSCVRFIRGAELLAYYQAPLCMIDVDTLIKGRWMNFCAQVGLTSDTELAVIHRALAPPWERVMAGFIYVRPTALGQGFLSDTAAFIADNIARRSVRWFLDQIALTAVFEAQVNKPANVVVLPAAQAFDLEHRADSFVWAITNHKSAWKDYNAYREQLAAAHGTAALATPDYFYEAVSRLGPVFFVQIGVMDGASYDPIFNHVRQHQWQGILVEPLPDMIARAKANYVGQAGLVFENVAITQQVETRTLYRVKPENAATANLPTWVTGMSSLVPDKLAAYQEHVVEETVQCMPLTDLLAKHRPARIDVLQIDTEGYDYKIFEQFDLARYQPRIINLEYAHLSADEKQRLQTSLMENGYIFFRHEQDLFAVKRNLMFPTKG